MITGGASGIGLKLGELLAARGEDLAILDRVLDPDALARLRAAGPGRVASAEVDVRDAAGVAAAVEAVVAEVGAPRLVVNSAGIQNAKTFDELTEDEFRAIVEINLIGSRNVAAATLGHLEATRGRLVLVASLAGLVANYGYTGYCASKYGVVGLGEVLRLEYRPRGVAVSVVCPPEVETPMVWEERRRQPPPSKALKELAGTIDVDRAARDILAGIDRGTFLIIPTARAKAAVGLARFLPKPLSQAVADRVVARALR